jgi:hypothetical protein
MAIRIGERVELVVEGAWFEKFSWSRQLLDPGLPQERGAPAFAIACTVVNLGHQAGIVARTDASWDGKGGKHEGFEILVPWSYVVAILEIGAEGGGARRIGFL